MIDPKEVKRRIHEWADAYSSEFVPYAGDGKTGHAADVAEVTEWLDAHSLNDGLLADLARMDPITGDRNEEILFWCVFCGEESDTKGGVRHRDDCLWLRISTATGKL